MFKMPEKIEYALPEQIGNPDLFVGRKEEFDYLLGDWYMTLEGNFAQNQTILSRRKKGKTSLLQRLFNILWSAGAERKAGEVSVIPFYYSIRDEETSLGFFAKDFFTQLIGQYLSYKKRDRELVSGKYDFKTLSRIIDDEELLELYETMRLNDADDNWKGLWRIASEAPSTIGRLKGEKIVQIIDEFQNINEYIYDQDKDRLRNMSGTYMYVSELREAPLIVSGSEVHWLLKIVGSLTGRFQTYNLSNLPKEEALEAMDRYAAFMRTTIDDEAKEKIWQLTKGDPLYIKALFMSRYNREKDYTVEENIVDVYEKEISSGEIYATWMEYMQKTFSSVNKVNSKRILLYLFNQGRERTRAEIIKDLKLNYTDEEMEEKLNALIAGDLISQGSTAYRYEISKDKTYELVFRRVYQDEIEHFVPDIKADIRKTMGRNNYTKGKFTEFLIREKIKKPFNLKDLCEPAKNLRIVPKQIKERETVSIGTGKKEIDLIIKAEKNREVWIDVKSTKNRYGKNEMRRWLSIVEQLKQTAYPPIFMVYSRSGFTKGTKERLIENGVFIVKE